MARIAILGANGMLGHMACKELSLSHDVVAIVRRTGTEAHYISRRLATNDFIDGIDALDRDRLETALRRIGPEIVLNCIGLVKQRPEARDTKLAIEINALLPHRLANLCREINAKLISISTDCVFSGTRGNYAETDLPDPVDTYGRTKLLGEISAQRHLTLRTSLIGPQLEGQEGLVAWFLAQRGNAIKGYRRAIFSGLTTKAMCQVLDRILLEYPSLSGIYHVSSTPISKLELLLKLAKRLDWPSPIESVENPVLDRSLDGRRFLLATGIPVPDWDEMIDALSVELRSVDIHHESLAPGESRSMGLYEKRV